MESQTENFKQRKYLIIKEEHPTTEKEIEEFENSKHLNLPKDYRNFLLNYNGGVPILNDPENFFSMERLYSLQDLKFGIIHNQKEVEEYVKEDIEEHFQNLDFEKIVFFGRTERGYLHIYCGKEDYGAIYFSNFWGGEGLEKTSYASFTKFMENVTSVNENTEAEYEINGKKFKDLIQGKIFTFNSFYWEKDIEEQSLKRFKEVLDFYGHPNKKYKGYYSRGGATIDVVSHYINNPIVLDYLLSIGGLPPDPVEDVNNIESLKLLHSHNANLSGLLSSTRNIQVFRYLIEICKHDINKSYNGDYPLLKIAKIPKNWGTTDGGIVAKYEYLQKILNLGYQVDFMVKDEEGVSLEENIEILKELYIESKERLEKGIFPNHKK